MRVKICFIIEVLGNITWFSEKVTEINGENCKNLKPFRNKGV
jgi:hypothetical protein